MSAAFEKPAWQLQKPFGKQLRPRLAPYQVGWGSTKIQVDSATILGSVSGNQPP
ncbi:hypothetical protein PCASD_13823 [Puccinia coronata f. sp. avenae]|uniref:Uncharacterized protein n=1 Tax=Puccinia coronata f. sp. avenae TaxID=200324 RepID=A0A2N5U5P4_9BASI|nr:hypothetical protein PCASD_13823 [Puccinia coronata f. sp. avenae]